MELVAGSGKVIVLITARSKHLDSLPLIGIRVFEVLPSIGDTLIVDGFKYEVVEVKRPPLQYSNVYVKKI